MKILTLSLLFLGLLLLPRTADPVDCWDVDTDGFDDCECATWPCDCEDEDPQTYPGADEICDGYDNDCDEIIPDDEIDEDLDGWMICDGDCRDTNEAINPDAEEGPMGDPSCSDGLDNDCDGIIDGGPGCT